MSWQQGINELAESLELDGMHGPIEIVVTKETFMKMQHRLMSMMQIKQTHTVRLDGSVETSNTLKDLQDSIKQGMQLYITINTTMGPVSVKYREIL